MRIKRREFLKTTMAAGAATAFGGPLLNAFASSADHPAGGGSTAPGKWMPSTCEGCTTWCAIEIFVQEGRAVKVRGNQRSKSNHGHVCPRGHLILQQVYDPDRVKVPMKRTNPTKGRTDDPRFVPISWDEAMDTIADRMLELRRNNESHKFVLLRGRYTYLNDFPYDVMPKIFGSPNNISHSSLCAEGEKFGWFNTDGLFGYHDFDLEKAKYLLVWGADPVASNRMVPNAIRQFGDLLDRGTLAVVDPRLSTAASKAHEWLPVKPGEDGALATAMAHVILTEGLWSREFVGDFTDGRNRFVAGQAVDEAAFAEKHTHGLVKWWNLELKDRTPDWAERVTLLPRAQIARVATGFAKAAPHCIAWLGPGVGMQPRGGYSAMAVSALNGLVGSIDHEGGVLWESSVPTGKSPSFEKYQDDTAKAGLKQKKIDQRGTKALPAMAAGRPGSGVVTNRVADAMLAADPYDIKMAIGYWNNFNFSAQGGPRWDRALSKLPFYVHITTHASEMTQFADIVLPAPHHATEVLSYMKSKAARNAYLTLNQPVIERLWDVRQEETEIVWMLAEKLKAKGFDRLYAYLSTEFKDPETGKSPTNGMEFTEIALKIHTAPLWKPKEPLKGDRLDGWQDFRAKGMYNSEPYPYKKKWGNFGTATKKFEFYSETLKKSLAAHAGTHKFTVDQALEAANYTAKGELAYVPHYEPPAFHGDEKEYPFLFIDYKSRLNREGRSANCTWYHEFKTVDPGDVAWDDVVKINPADARRLGLAEGDRVRVSSPSGSMEVRVRLWEGVRPGTATKSYGQGHSAYGRIAAKDFGNRIPRGGSNNDILPADYERLSGSSARHGLTRVKIAKV
jgi:anaerobic selenocysteine-containing dehydrogenase